MEADSDRLARAGALLSWEGASARLAGDLERAVGARQRWRDEFESYSQLAEDIEDLQKVRIVPLSVWSSPVQLSTSAGKACLPTLVPATGRQDAIEH